MKSEQVKEWLEGLPVEAGRVTGGGGGLVMVGGRSKWNLFENKQNHLGFCLLFLQCLKMVLTFFWATVTDNHIKTLNKHAFLFSVCNSDKKEYRKQETKTLPTVSFFFGSTAGRV